MSALRLPAGPLAPFKKVPAGGRSTKLTDALCAPRATHAGGSPRPMPLTDFQGSARDRPRRGYRHGYGPRHLVPQCDAIDRCVDRRRSRGSRMHDPRHCGARVLAWRCEATQVHDDASVLATKESETRATGMRPLRELALALRHTQSERRTDSDCFRHETSGKKRRIAHWHWSKKHCVAKQPRKRVKRKEGRFAQAHAGVFDNAVSNLLHACRARSRGPYSKLGNQSHSANKADATANANNNLFRGP